MDRTEAAIVDLGMTYDNLSHFYNLRALGPLLAAGGPKSVTALIPRL